MTKQETLLGGGPPGGEQQDKGTQENCSATWLTVLGFMMMGLVSRLSLANHSNSGSFLVVHTLLGQDRFQKGGFWEVGRTCGISFGPFLNLLAGGGLLVLCSLPGSPAVKYSNKWSLWNLARWAVSVYVSPSSTCLTYSFPRKPSQASGSYSPLPSSDSKPSLLFPHVVLHVCYAFRVWVSEYKCLPS